MQEGDQQEQARVALARQPILDLDHVRVGYELLHRGQVTEGSRRTAEVMVEAIATLGLASVVGDARAWINLPLRSLTAEHHLVLPPDRVVLEVLEEADGDVVRPIIDRARAAGYTVALDDYGVGSTHDDLVEHVDWVKVDLLLPGAWCTIEQLARRGIPVLAEKVETVADQRRATDAGATLLQGFYFARPELVPRTVPGEVGVALIRLVGLLHAAEPDLDAVTATISTDASLTAQVLTLVNSSWVAPGRRFTSAREAVVHLGLDQVRRIATISLLRGLGSRAPLETLRTGILRASLCEAAADRTERSTAYTVGLLSVLGAATGDDLTEEDLEPLGLPGEVAAAISSRTGPLGALLADADACVRGERVPTMDDHFPEAASAADAVVASFEPATGP